MINLTIIYTSCPYLKRERYFSSVNEMMSFVKHKKITCPGTKLISDFIGHYRLTIKD